MNPDGPRLGPGTMLGPYRILSPLGAGGMGEVYRARDTKLDRDVAVKVLPGAFADDAERLVRFEREAKALAALNHPNLLSIHDFGEAGGIAFSVTELLEGQTLRAKILAGPMDVQEALGIGIQITRGLAAAHEKGVIHRDLKPANIFVTADGHVKVLDFGLARLEAPAPPRGEPVSEAATADLPTSPGTVLGTAGYMSPEQIRGQPADCRSDLFSLGVILYEMVSGRRPFEGDSEADSLAAVLRTEPPPLSLPESQMSPGFDALVRRCLAKRPDERYQTARELLAALKELAGGSSLSFMRVSAGRDGSRRVVLLAGLFLTAAVMVVGVWLRVGARHSGLPSFEPRQVTSRPGLEESPAISPDGNTVAFCAWEGGASQIWVADVSGGTPLRLTSGTANHAAPCWFPDGSAVVFSSEVHGKKTIWKIPRLGGAPVLLVEDAEEPAISPDGTRIAFARPAPGGSYLRIWVAPLADPRAARMLTGDGDGTWDHQDLAWSPDGATLCYWDQNDLWLVPAVGGKARPLTHDVPPDMDPAWSPEGTTLYFDSLREGTWAIWKVPAGGGNPERVTLGTGGERHPSLSRDGRRLAYETHTDHCSIVLLDRRSGLRTDVPVGRMAYTPALSPDEKSLLFSSNREGSFDLWRIALHEGKTAGEPERMTEQAGYCSNPVYSPDGRWIAYQRLLEREGGKGSQRDVWVMPASGGASTDFTDAPSMEGLPRWAPDGSEIAFLSDRGGSIQVWSAPFRDGRRTGEPRQITHAAGDVGSFAWSPDGKRLACTMEDGQGQDLWMCAAAGEAPIKRITTGAGITWFWWDKTSGDLLAVGRWGGDGLSLRVVHPNSGEIADARFREPQDPQRELVQVTTSERGNLIAFLEEAPEGDVWVLLADKGSF